MNSSGERDMRDVIEQSKEEDQEEVKYERNKYSVKDGMSKQVKQIL